MYSRLEPVEIDRLARKVERETLEKVQGSCRRRRWISGCSVCGTGSSGCRTSWSSWASWGTSGSASRSLQTDEIFWQTFEDVAWMLGVQ